MRIPRREFDQLVEAAIAALPAQVAEWVDEVPIIVEDQPGKEMDAVGLYEGRSLLDRGVEDSGGLPSRIFIYRLPLMESCGSREELAREIWKTLVHELGHHAGLGEEELDRLGYGGLDGDVDFDVD